MAEEKKPAKSAPAEHQSDSKTVEQIITILAVMLLIGAVAQALFNSLANLGSGSLWGVIVEYFIEHIWPVWKLVTVIISGLAIVGIIHNYRKLTAINIEEAAIYGVIPGSALPEEEEYVEAKNEKWEKVLQYMNSDNSSDWRLAIIEADVILEDLLRSLGYRGDSVGEMLQSVDKSDFITIEDAWQAHKVRNSIAHSRGNFQLNERETRRVVALFEKVFEEFDVI